MKKNKGFTLIELVAVLVILAILALIVTPLVLNIIRKARTSADKRSIDAYGRSIELAVASYLLDEGKFPTSVEQLTIEYSGDKVECETTKLNTDSSVYLASCTVAGRDVTGYTYGKEETVTYEAYTVGNQVSYNNVDYYVIADSDETNSSVTLLKAEPLTVEEVNTYGGVGTDNNYINKYNCPSHSNCYQTAYNKNGYGGMAYYSSETCGYVNDNRVDSGCTTDYAQSDVKYVVDAWKAAQASLATEARLITLDEYRNICDIETYETPTELGKNYIPRYDWMYNSNYKYWTMSTAEDYPNLITTINSNGLIGGDGVAAYAGGVDLTVRPVITLSKSLLSL